MCADGLGLTEQAGGSGKETIKKSWNLSECPFQNVGTHIDRESPSLRGRGPRLGSNPAMASDGQGYSYLSILRPQFLNKNMPILFWQVDVRIRDNLLTMCRILLM